ncbi:unnamed protein product [Onchocerca ochengi]|uniref:Peroxin-1 n=1 Tax=Onchocerca ochengi TaxID=42157 RepID=A0A182E2Z7_ONCOC|nr:unnamed protein product [Onchocerca ochengi]
METYSAVLKYHQQRNCFGYIQQRYSDIARITNIQINSTTSGAYNIIRRENLTNFGIIQVFASNVHSYYRPQTIFINKIFADLLGLGENEEVIAQKVEKVPVCSLFEVELTSAEDWNAVQHSSRRIEELLLRQIQLITVGQTYPIWIAQNLYIYFIVDQSNSEIITISTVYNSETGQTAHALLIELPITCSRFAALKNCLKGKLPGNFNECLRNHLWKTCQHYPIIVPVDGFKVEMNLIDRTRLQCRIRPHLDEKKNDKSRKCIVFTNDIFPLLKYQNTELVKDSLAQLEGTNVNKDIHQAVVNFDERKSEAIEFSFQIAFIQKCYTYIMYHLEKSTFLSSGNIFIVGNKSAGKTTILHFLAEKLLHSHLAVYSECLYCSDWNGKSIEKFQDVLKATMMRLRRRYPSVLFLDNLDFLLHGQDEDLRNVRLERCVELLRNLATEINLLIVATACAKRDIIQLFSLNAGGRFFSHVESIKELSPVSY